MLALLVGVPSFTLFVQWNENCLKNDVAQHLSVARNILEGNGFKTSIIYYDEHFHIGKIPAEQTVFPPGYPLAIASLSWFGVPLNISAFIICILSFNCCTLLIIKLLRDVGHAWGIALFGGLLWAFSITAISNVLFSLSDVPFAFATVACFFFVQRMRADGIQNALLAGAAASGSLSIRYAGVFLIFSLGIVFTGRFIILRTRKAFVEIAAILAFPALMMCLLFYRNYLLVGDLKGGNANQIARSLADVANTFIWSLQELIGYSKTGLITLQWRETILFLAICIILISILYIRPSIEKNRIQALMIESSHILPMVFIASSLSFLWYLEQTRYLGVSGRMLLPLLPPAIILAAGFATSLKWPNYPLLGKTISALLVGLYLLGQTARLPALFTHESMEFIRSLRVTLGESIITQKLLANDNLLNFPIISNQAQYVGAILEQPVIGFTPPFYTDKKWTRSEVENTVRHFSVRHVLFFPQIFANEDENTRANQDFFNDIVRNDIPPWLNPVYVSENIIVFEVEQ